MKTITVICSENNANYPDPLIYTVKVNDPSNLEEVRAAVTAERRNDLGDDVEFDIEPLFAFSGNLQTCADYRE